ncbi:hypothetical protein GC093_03165 [Paenibacillus sp. LMG 31456]|uniref:Uncharacterized protein n=1 Tax=Paenibacillus foliorum TaxID=2654974 RepID=A0A972GR16_9BACL|nr:hypothetical protein [Paenibacillus foliorum]NOU92237.1 hypothetical protein [Paenibacillus foliorum]
MNTGQSDKRKFLFNVDILIEEDSNGRALEKLLHMLNSTDIQDYLIKEGILLGKTIEIALRETISKKKTSPEETPALAPRQDAKSNMEIWKQFQHFKLNNTLIRLTIIKGKGIKLNMPCRILNIDLSTDNVSVYHVDEKQVYLFKINEIEDFAVTS